VAAVATQLHRPTAFNLELTVKSVSFNSAAHESVLEKTPFAALSMHGIDHGDVDRARCEILAQGCSGDAASSGALPAKVGLDLPVRISATRSTGAAATFKASKGGDSPLGELDRLFVGPGSRVELGVPQENPSRLSLNVADKNQDLRFGVSLHRDSTVQLVDAKIESTKIDTGGANPLMLSSVGDCSFVLDGIPTGATLRITPAAKDGVSNLLRRPLPVSALKVTTGQDGVAESTVAGPGSISIEHGADAKKITLAKGDFVELGDFRKFYVRGLEFQPETRTIRLLAGGTLGSLRAGPAGLARERALTWFESIKDQPGWAEVFGLAVWFLSTTLAGYKLFKELRQ
jgi:hypothetical protein